MNIVVALGKEYCQHTGVMLYSLIKNTRYLHDINLYIVTDNFECEPFKKLLNFSKKIGYKVNLIPFSSHAIASFPVTHHISIATYFRLLLPDILPVDINKILYLDSDLVIQGDIQELWETNLHDLPLAAIRDQEHYLSRREVLGIKDENFYFNGGVLLIDLEKWRKQGISKILLEYVLVNPDKILWWDQDALNAVMGNNYYLLDDVWNAQTYYLANKSDRMVNDYKIIHYTTEQKPWLYLHNHPLKDRYFKYLLFTPWRSFFFKYALEKLLYKFYFKLRTIRFK